MRTARSRITARHRPRAAPDATPVHAGSVPVRQPDGRRRRLCTAALVTAAVTATAVVGSIGTKPDSAWFRGLAKPRWYPDAAVFPIAWTALYGTIAWAGTRALNRSSGKERSGVVRALGTNLALNAGWSWASFRAQRLGLALGVVLAMDASNLSLLRRVWRQDAVAGAALVPYVAWTGFATALTEEIWFRN